MAKKTAPRWRAQSPSVFGSPKESWILELLGFVVVAVALAAIVALLSRYNGQLNPQFPVTLNVMASLLGAVANAATLTGAQSSIAQLKWIWFARRTRPLNELASFQNARSGPLGAAQLLFKTGPFHVAAVGALAVVISLLSEPFIQNLIHYDSRNIQDASQISLLARNTAYNFRGPPSAFQESYPDPLLALNMQVALASAPETDANLPRYICSTGNCTWEPVAILGFCALCADLSSVTVVNCTSTDNDGATCQFNQPKTGAQLRWTSDYGGSLMDIRTVNTSLAEIYKNSTGPVFQSLRMINPDIGNHNPAISSANYMATECSLNLCVLSIQPSVSLSSYSETILDMWTQPDSIIGYPAPLRPPWGPEKGVAPNQSFTFDLVVALDWEEDSFPSGLITGTAASADDIQGVSFNATASFSGEAQKSVIDFIYYLKSTPADCGSPNNDNFACAMRLIAGAMTKTIRNSGFQPNGTNSTDYFALGHTQVSATFVRVEWYWMALPVAVWLFGVLTWLTTLVQTRRWHLPGWRDNALPLLFMFGEDGSERQGSSGLLNDSNEAYEELARNLWVRLLHNDTGTLRLVQEQSGTVDVAA